MYQIAINDPMAYLDGETYAKENHSSLEEMVNKYVASLAASIRSRKKSSAGSVPFSQTEEFKKALIFVKTKTAKGGIPVPVDEDGLASLVDTKYKS